MTSAALHFIPAAKADLHDIWHYTVKMWGEAQAERYVASLQSACHQLVKSPLLGKLMPDLGDDVRAYRCGQHYIFYLERSREVIFLAFIHERRDLLKHVIARLS